MRAFALLSGGLDSILAAKLIQQQNIEVIPLHYQIPFCKRSKDPMSASDRISQLTQKYLHSAIRTIDIKNEFLEIVRAPAHGFGSHMNPCIDCKILMLSHARAMMQQEGVAFVVTGEVVGQRPMSQHKKTLELIMRKSGLEGLLVRPLSAKILPDTIPEQKGWISGEKLLDFNGRTRKPQFALAKELGVAEYAQPAGGCLLTDPIFSKRLKDLVSHDELNSHNVELLKIGRHFRVDKHTKLIVGRDEKEDAVLVRLAQESDYLFYPDEVTAGATSLGRGEFNEELLILAARITGRYFDLHGKPEAEILYRRANKQEDRRIKVCPLPEEELVKLRI